MDWESHRCRFPLAVTCQAEKRQAMFMNRGVKAAKNRDIQREAGSITWGKRVTWIHEMVPQMAPKHIRDFITVQSVVDGSLVRWDSIAVGAAVSCNGTGWFTTRWLSETRVFWDARNLPRLPANARGSPGMLVKSEIIWNHLTSFFNCHSMSLNVTHHILQWSDAASGTNGFKIVSARIQLQNWFLARESQWQAVAGSGVSSLSLFGFCFQGLQTTGTWEPGHSVWLWNPSQVAWFMPCLVMSWCYPPFTDG